MMRLSKISIKEALSLLRLGFSVEEIFELDKELSGGEKAPTKEVKKNKPHRKKSTTTKTASKKTKPSHSTNDEEFISLLTDIRDDLKDLKPLAEKINP